MKLINLISKYFLFSSVLALFPYSAFAEGGVSLGATRVIYTEGAKQGSIPVTNSSPSQRYLINSWIENNQGNRDTSFVVTPPLYVSEANTESSLRMVYVGNPLPSDRESLYYLNVKAIPSIDKAATAGKNVLQIAILSRIKLFVRPQNLPYQQQEAAEKLTFAHSSSNTTVDNPTPYYVTLVNVKVDGKSIENIMVAPLSHQTLASAGHQISFQSVNDFGGLDKPMNKTIN